MIESMLTQASTYAADIDGIFALVFWIVLFWFLAAEGMFLWLIMRFRASNNPKSEYITGKEKHLKRWITIPHAFILLFDIWIVVVAVQVWHQVKIDLPEGEATVRVTGQQWAWIFQHPGPDNQLDTADDITMLDELHIEVGTLYHYQLESRDVLHNFSVPVFRLKQDAIPGRRITGWFEATQAGEFDIQCAEICGIGHGIMGARIFVEDALDHANWMAQNVPNAEIDGPLPALAQEAGETAPSVESNEQVAAGAQEGLEAQVTVTAAAP